MESAIVLVIIFVGVLIATGLFRPVMDSLIGGLVKIVTVILVLVIIGVYVYGKLFS